MRLLDKKVDNPFQPENFYNDNRSVDSDFIKNLPQNERESLIPKFYAHFIYNGKHYFKFSVGDIAIREQFKDKPNGEYFFRKNAWVVFSLTNPFHYNNKCYKMVAQVF